MSDGDVSLQLTLKSMLRRAEASLHQANGRFGSPVGLRMVGYRNLANDVDALELEQIGRRGHELYNCRFIVAADGHSRVTQPRNADGKAPRGIASTVDALLRHRVRNKDLGRAVNTRKYTK